MTTLVEPEELETTRSEKALAVVLAVFILIGGLWGYFNLDEVADPGVPRGGAEAALAPAEQDALKTLRIAQNNVFAAQRNERSAERELILRREEYRTALDAGDAAPQLKAAYEEAVRRFDAAEERVASARERLAASEVAAQPAQEALRAQEDEYESDQDRQDLIVLGLRIALILAGLAGAYLLLARMRARRSRFLPAALAWAGAWAVLALVMAIDYTTDTIEITDVGPLALSIAGIALTLLAFAVLQRYLARQIPLRRVRRSQCPFCGFPGGGEHCEGCGRSLVGPCAACQAPRRVGSQHCSACGEA